MLSVVVLTHNDQGNLERTLDSLEWCDELVVVDDDSHDDTLDIAKRKHAQIYRRRLDGDFATQRNYGLQKAKGEWVLFVDSDEVVSPELARQIQAVIQKTDTDGFYLKRQDIIFGRPLQYGETANVRLLRLAKKSAGDWQRSVHEIWNISGPTKTLAAPLLHYPHQTVAEFLADVNTYSTINARHMYSEGKTVFWFDIVVYPLGKFFHNYFIRQGFHDGMPGAILALMMSFHSFLTRGKLYALNHPQP